jgi:hypothetical protein
MNAVATIEQHQTTNIATGSNLTSASGWELAQRVSKALAASTLVPEAYRNNIPNCIIALEIANRLGASPLLVMQNLYIVHGRPGWSSQFLIATFNQCGRFSAMRFEFFGESGKDSWGCRAWAIEKETGEKITGADVTIKTSKDEGWYSKNGSKWKTMPQQMLMYRAASWFVRAYAPELSMGLQTQDELVDVGQVPMASVTTAGREPGAIAQLESELTGRPVAAQETAGDSSRGADASTGITPQEIHDALLAAKDQDRLDEAADLIRMLPEAERPPLLELWQKRADELAQA